MSTFTKQFFYLLDRQARKAIPFLLLSFIISSILDVVGVGLIGLFLGLLTNPSYLANKFSYSWLALPTIESNKILELAGIFIIIAFALKAILVMSIQKRIILFGQSLAVRLKTRLMTAFQYAPYVYHLKKNSDHLISRLQGNLDSYIGNVVMAILYLLSNALITVFILSLLFYLHPVPSLILLISFIIFGLSYDLIARKKISLLGKQLAKTNGEISKSVREGLHGVTEARVLGREKYFIDKLTKNSIEHAHSYGVLTARQMLPRYLIENMMAIFIVAVCLFGMGAGYSSVKIVAMVGVFAAAGARLLPTFTQIITNINQIRSYYHQMDLVYNEFLEVDQLTQNSLQKNLLQTHKEKLQFDKVELRQVCFHYPESSLVALSNIDLTFYKGQSIGLIGRSGAGKSTLVNLILGFLEPQQGKVLIDGKPLVDLRGWLNNFAYISQVIFLLDDTLKRNVAFGINDEEIDEQRVWNAIKLAQLEDVVKNLPAGLETWIGENGVRFSGGQRQRVALARAFYHERDIIVMDEATSSLDNETEKEVISTIKRLKGEKTLIVIAHRLSTIEHCDILYRLDKGKIIATGTYQEIVTTA